MTVHSHLDDKGKNLDRLSTVELILGATKISIYPDRGGSCFYIFGKVQNGS